MTLNAFDAKHIGSNTNEIEFLLETSAPAHLFIKVKAKFFLKENLFTFTLSYSSKYNLNCYFVDYLNLIYITFKHIYFTF